MTSKHVPPSGKRPKKRKARESDDEEWEAEETPHAAKRSRTLQSAPTGELALSDEQWGMLKCELCKQGTDDSQLLLCDGCDLGFHMYCLRPRLSAIPSGDWYCAVCRQNERFGANKGGERPTLTSLWSPLPNLMPLPVAQRTERFFSFPPSQTLCGIDWSHYRLTLIPPPLMQKDERTGALVARYSHSPRTFLFAAAHRPAMFPSAVEIALNKANHGALAVPNLMPASAQQQWRPPLQPQVSFVKESPGGLNADHYIR